jgi:RNA polymerase sigma factor (sigma-70 family)
MPLKAELLHRCIKGDPKAQFEVYRQYYWQVKTVCSRYSSEGQDLNALVNESFFRILTGINMYQVHIPFEWWAKKVAIHVVIDNHRKEKKYREFMVIRESVEETCLENPTWNDAVKKLNAEDLQSVLFELPDMYRKAFSLFAIDGFSHKEIADILQVKEGTSKWYVSEARDMLRKKLENKLSTKEYQSRELKDVR